MRGYAPSITSTFFCFILLLTFSSCATTTKIGGPIRQNLKDGLYEGSYKGGPNKAVVEVRIESNRIVDIRVLKHTAMRGVKAEPIIPNRIVEEQSTDVDAVSGATNSSYVLMNAVQKAVEKAYID